MSYRSPSTLVLSCCSILTLAACSSVKTEAVYPSGADRGETGGDIYGERQTIWGQGGGILGGLGVNKGEDGSAGIGVNSYLWRASLETVSFMPLASADPFGGVILTDWYTAPETPDERFKVNVFILGKQLRSDGVRVRVFRQVARKGAWADADVPPDMGRQLEDTILTRARQLRVAQDGE
ncbi:MAG: DUF3576 domain-containing protein [Alphaproteobacteria bacterium]|nr:DUF3576 domain-containing protein [Alphaproteobacteria bacterium]